MRASFCLDVTSMLSKGIITILLMDIGKNDDDYEKVKVMKGCSTISFTGRGNVLPIKGKLNVLSATFQSK